MEAYLERLVNLPLPLLLCLLLLQNLLVFAGALLAGYAMRKWYHVPIQRVTVAAWKIGLLTVLINTVITIAGALLWKHGYIRMTYTSGPVIVGDTLILFFAMDMLMYVFHYVIHHTFLYRAVHALHHEAVNPTPIDLFVLHPVETAGFGILWLLILWSGTYNIWSIIIYLVLNVIFGVAGHLGFEPLQSYPRLNRWAGLILGTSAFHHAHHRDVHGNFGFYTSLWDRLFHTYLPVDREK
ncbi:Sterol desaturase/sphingolipid hydroxylase, fatty acid hydroxylase superfamily [Chitinophaga arvensicola]|uniref:Sterol desaturase/sphingolipid hydroxylase, fatty acid hydroxylase superfamily n=2 Tax=Chitinophaga arvensicola TaxID=29529 RepID=A0A1I0S5J7_9BACT|nr:Sterol desaturase/sphingolipid hydroxylase, fatty acid hydroxylase superfamily [Chitinophaga arvensicola]